MCVSDSNHEDFAIGSEANWSGVVWCGNGQKESELSFGELAHIQAVRVHITWRKCWLTGCFWPAHECLAVHC